VKQPCGCCAGVQIVTPEREANRPGLSAIGYRMGTWATFFESMLARLSTLHLDVPLADSTAALRRIYPLRQLATRDPSDPSIALLDAWAIVADVLTFYQERIANEGYLITAIERRSILEFARLVGYKLRPGVAASVYLAFTTANGFSGDIPAGTRAQSIPGTGETAQFFETSDKLAARDIWNILKLRRTRPQVITQPPAAPINGVSHLGTNANIVDSIWFRGISTNLNPGDPLLIVLGDGAGQQFLRFVEAVDPQADQKRTEVTLQQGAPSPQPGEYATLQSALQRFIEDATALFEGSDLANEAAALIQGLLDAASAASGAAALATATAQTPTPLTMLEEVVPQIETIYDIAVKRQFTRLRPWLGHLLETMGAVAGELATLEEATAGPALLRALQPTSLSRLGTLLDALGKPPSLQPANPIRLTRTVASAFSPHADTAPRILAALRPAMAPLLYAAWGNVVTPSAPVKVYAMRTKAGLFGHNAPLRVTGVVRGQVRGYADWPVVEIGPRGNQISHENNNVVFLDGSYDKIVPGSWIVIQTPTPYSDPPKDGFVSARPLFAKTRKPQTGRSRSDYGISAATTRIELAQSANPSLNADWINTADATAVAFTDPNGDFSRDFNVIRTTTVYAQPELLELAEEPIDRDVSGNSLELDGLYDGLEPGRWIIVSGERTDIPEVTGVNSSELVMIAGVSQGAGGQSCRTQIFKVVPLSRIFYITDTNDDGDRLVVGAPAAGALEALRQMAPPDSPNQMFCDRIQLGPGVFAEAYVPTAAELAGDFSTFAAVFQDPIAGGQPPIANGIIPQQRLNPSRPDAVFAWRITRVTSGSDTIHTTLTLANNLAYAYDSANVAIYGNVTEATHGQTIGEVLGDGDATQVFQTFALRQSPLTYVSAPTVDGAQSTLVVRVNDIQWHEAGDLAELGPRDRGYFTRADNAATTSVIFGSGERGARLPTGSANVKATYRYGIGKPGNVKAGQISQLASHPLGLQRVLNPLRASGGADTDGRDQARRNTPMAVMALDRLVSIKDYADFARTYAGIGKAISAKLSDGRRQMVHVTVAGEADISIDQNSDLYRNLVTSLEQFGDPHLPIQVCVRKVKLLVISARLQLLPDYDWESVEPRVRAALLDAFSFDARQLGQTAFQSEAVGVMQRVKGVAYVDLQIFDSVAEDITVEQLALLASTLAPNPFVLAQMAHPNAGADALASTDPCVRVLPAELVFLTPDIPDTLLLAQIGG